MNTIFHKLLDRLSVGIVLIDQHQKIVLWNNWMERKTQLTAEEASHQPLTAVCPKFEKPLYSSIIENALEKGQARFISGAVHGAFFNQADKEATEGFVRQNLQIEALEDEHSRYVLIQIIDVTNQHQKVQHMKTFIKTLESANDEMRLGEEKARQLALTDPLTGLCNRLSFMNQLERLADPLHRNGDITAIIYLDLDAFKQVNDVHGHAIGDLVLQETAKRLKQALRSTDIIARLGGDEFTMILQGIQSIQDVHHIALKIHNSFSTPLVVNTLSLPLPCSFGISLMPSDGKDPKELLEKADMTLYRVKKSGKGGFAFFSDRSKIFR